MKRLKYKKVVDNEIIFSTEAQLIDYLSNNVDGILFAVRDDNIVYAVMPYKMEWMVGNAGMWNIISWEVLVNEYDLYYVGNDQVNHMLETFE